jgi:acetyl esterase/lipase
MERVKSSVRLRLADWPYLALLIVASLAFGSLAQADDHQGLRRGGDPKQVSISGLSSGGAMALQYAVAHSSSIIGVGSIAGPAWSCAEGDLSHAMQVCLKGQGTPQAKTDLARQLAAAGKVDSLPGNATSALKQSFVFQSGHDEVVNPRSGRVKCGFSHRFNRDRTQIRPGAPR